MNIERKKQKKTDSAMAVCCPPGLLSIAQQRNLVWFELATQLY